MDPGIAGDVWAQDRILRLSRQIKTIVAGGLGIEALFPELLESLLLGSLHIDEFQKLQPLLMSTPVHVGFR